MLELIAVLKHKKGESTLKYQIYFNWIAIKVIWKYKSKAKQSVNMKWVGADMEADMSANRLSPQKQVDAWRDKQKEGAAEFSIRKQPNPIPICMGLYM